MIIFACDTLLIVQKLFYLKNPIFLPVLSVPGLIIIPLGSKRIRRIYDLHVKKKTLIAS